VQLLVVHVCSQSLRLNVKMTMTDRLATTRLDKCRHRERLCLRVLYEVKNNVEATCVRPSVRISGYTVRLVFIKFGRGVLYH
jgi:hypothetical protein